MVTLKARIVSAVLVLVAVIIAVTVLASLPRRQSASPRPRASAEAAAPRRQPGFPNASDTGVSVGARLRKVPRQVSSGPGWRFDRRGFVQVYGEGAVLRDLYIPYNVNVDASHVTISDIKVVIGGRNTFGISLRHTHDVTIEDSTISGINNRHGRVMAGIKDIFGDSTGLRVLGNNISRFETGIQLEAGYVAGNYIHSPGFVAGDHTNGIMSNGGGRRRLTITHNTILINRGQTDAIGLFEDFGVQQNRRITDNLLAGGGYAIYAGQKRGGPPTKDIVIRGNQISTIYFARGGYYGCAAHFDAKGRDNVWSGNKWNTTVIARYSSCD